MHKIVVSKYTKIESPLYTPKHNDARLRRCILWGKNMPGQRPITAHSNMERGVRIDYTTTSANCRNAWRCSVNTGDENVQHQAETFGSGHEYWYDWYQEYSCHDMTWHDMNATCIQQMRKTMFAIYLSTKSPTQADDKYCAKNEYNKNHFALGLNYKYHS
jgi:hypothetical protein